MNNKKIIESVVPDIMYPSQPDFWLSIDYTREDWQKNYRVLSEIKYKELNKKRIELNEQLSCPPIFKTIKSIAKKATNQPEAKFDDLYSIIYNKDVLYEAFARLKKNKGIFTKGTTNTTADQISQELINTIHTSLKTKTFKFTPIRRVQIPKPGKKETRPLGIPSLEDRIVQSAIKIILESIFEPEFQRTQTNFGFRPGLGCHNAITITKIHGQAKRYTLEGDIKGAFDNVNFKKLMNILSKKITDKDFLELINTGLNCGSLTYKNEYSETLIGVPQGGIVSPLLFNIYMHEFDKYIIDIEQKNIEQKNKKEKRITTPINREYQKMASRVRRQQQNIEKIYISNKIYKFAKLTQESKEKLKKSIKLLHTQQKELLKYPSIDYNKRSLSIIYVRYADDWILLTNADKQYVTELKDRISIYLKTNLGLTLSEEKTKITDITKNYAKFLGFNFYINISNKKEKLKKIKDQGTELQHTITTLKRTSDRYISVTPDMDRILKRFELDRFITKDHKRPNPKKEWIHLKDFEIIGRYNSKMLGIYNYYYPMITSKKQLNYIHYLLYYSCLFTLALKYNKRITNFFEKGEVKITFDARYHTFFPGVERSRQTGNLLSKYRLLERQGENPDWQKLQLTQSITLLSHRTLVEMAHKITRSQKYKYYAARKIYIPNYRISQKAEEYLFEKPLNWRTQYKLNKYCCICGSISNLESHHLKHIKKTLGIGFNQINSIVNRKQIVVCASCHRKIHQGKYNNISLEEFYDPEIMIL